MKQIVVFLSLITFILSGCAGYRPIVDMQGKSQQVYENDLRECQAYAERVSPASNAAVSGAAGAAIGAGMGAIIGAFFGCADSTAGFGAAVGGASGVVSGAGHGVDTQKNIIRRCMQGRGWNVLH